MHLREALADQTMEYHGRQIRYGGPAHATRGWGHPCLVVSGLYGHRELYLSRSCSEDERASRD